MSRKIPQELTKLEWPDLWCGRRFIANPMHVVPTSGKKTRHFTGGPARHAGAKCPECKRPLTLLWDVDLKDKSIPEAIRGGFSPATRLPFYVCLRCLVAHYLVVSDDRLKCLPFDSYADPLPDETLFADVPSTLERRGLKLERIPSTIDAIASLADEIGVMSLDDPAQKSLADYCGTENLRDWDLPMSQLGGSPRLGLAHRDYECPNPKCPASDNNPVVHPFFKRFFMKELALIHWCEEPILAKHCFQLMYHICGICFAIRCHYDCD